MAQATAATQEANERALIAHLWEEKRQQCRADAFTFTQYVFGGPGWVKPAPMHRDWHALTTGPDAPSRLVLFAPVDHAKSTIFSKAIPLWLIGTNPDTRGAIISATATRARKSLASLETLIDSDAPEARRARWIFPRLRRERRKGRPEKWTDTEMLVERDAIHDDPTIQVMGIDGGLLGSRLDWIICDDLCTVDTALSEAGRQMVSRRFWAVVASRLEDGGKVWMIGTAWHPDDIMHEVRAHGYHSVTYRTPHLLPGDEGREDVKLGLWPERWSEERLLAEKGPGKMPAHEFDRQCLCVATSESMRVFRPEFLKQALERGQGFELWDTAPANGNGSVLLVGVDLSGGEKATSDRTVMFLGERDHMGRKVVRHIRIGRWGQTEILKNVLDIQRRYRPFAFAVESNATQVFIKQALRDRDIMLSLGATAQDLAGLKIIPTITGGKAKTDPILGIKGMAMDFEAGKWAVPDGAETREWIGELERWTPDSHTGDVLSASYQWEMGLRKVGVA